MKSFIKVIYTHSYIHTYVHACIVSWAGGGQANIIVLFQFSVLELSISTSFSSKSRTGTGTITFLYLKLELILELELVIIKCSSINKNSFSLQHQSLCDYEIHIFCVVNIPNYSYVYVQRHYLRNNSMGC